MMFERSSTYLTLVSVALAVSFISGGIGMGTLADTPENATLTRSDLNVSTNASNPIAHATTTFVVDFAIHYTNAGSHAADTSLAWIPVDIRVAASKIGMVGGFGTVIWLRLWRTWKHLRGGNR